ncbi:MAG: winged helix-turn-helix domain-containing protein [Candidatus Omnitrophota bacterium]
MEIGIIAGDVWHYLEQNKKAALDDLVKALDRERDQVLMSVGWLSREGHVVLEGEGPDYTIYLRKGDK